MRRADVGIRIRADAKFARLIDRAAELTGKSRSAFIRDAALTAATWVIRAEAGMLAVNRRPELADVDDVEHRRTQKQRNEADEEYQRHDC